MPGCVVCKAFVSLIATPIEDDFSKHFSFTESEDPVAWNCNIHASVLELSNQLDNGILNRGRISLSKEKGRPTITLNYSTLHLSQRDNVPGHYGMGNLIQNDQWIDLETVKSIFQNCLATHGHVCGTFPFGEPASQLPMPTYLVDVEERCILEVNNIQVPFLLLSYVRPARWQQDWRCLLQNNLDGLKQRGALTSDSMETRLPRTFHDAIHLAQLFSYKYIWIEHLCVIQDVSTHLASETANKAFYSARADLVIVECDDTDLSHGIRGVSSIPNARPRRYQQKKARFGSEEIFIRPAASIRDFNPAPDPALPPTCLLQAESFVETVLARRVLRFENGSVRLLCHSDLLQVIEDPDHMWEDCAHACNRTKWGCQLNVLRADNDDYDTEDEQDEQDEETPHWSKMLQNSWPQPVEYYNMVRELSSLLRSESLINISAALTSPFARDFANRNFLFGLPEDLFDTFMLWKLRSDSQRASDAPSWSWLGWKRLPDSSSSWEILHSPEIDGADHIIMKPFNTVEIIATISWSIGAQADTQLHDRVILQSRKWYNSRERYQNINEQPPTGWLRVPQESKPLDVPLGYKRNTAYEYQSERGPNSFWYPIPMSSRHEDALPRQKSIQSFAFLFGTTELSQDFCIHRNDWHTAYEGDDIVVQEFLVSVAHAMAGTHLLRDSKDRIAGSLDVHARDHVTLLHGEAAPERTGLDLIALSKGRTLQRNCNLPECSAREHWQRLSNKKWYEFYNVMWVAWSEGNGVKVALRRGLGRVESAIWEQSQKQTLDVVLN